MNALELADAVEPLVLSSFYEAHYIGREAAAMLRKQHDELQRFAELVRNEAIDKRVKVKIGDQYGNDLNGHWFYLQPADEEAQKVLDNRSMKK